MCWVKLLKLPESFDSSLPRCWEEYHITEESDVEEQTVVDHTLTVQIPLLTKAVLILYWLSSRRVTAFQK